MGGGPERGRGPSPLIGDNPTFFLSAWGYRGMAFPYLVSIPFF